MRKEHVVVSCNLEDLKGEIHLSGSKSISNRVLLIKALCGRPFEIFNLSDSDDTVTMHKLLNGVDENYDAHHAGTTFRFLTAYLATQDGIQFLTGSERMKQRPVKALVDALNYLGANITYTENEGYPPLKIGSPSADWKKEITLSADISSQYITALLLIAPILKDGLKIHLKGNIVSKPYIEMTINIMNYFGVSVLWDQNTLEISQQKYKEKDFHVEADWSAASYYYTIAGFCKNAELTLHGLHKFSLQGDSAIVEIGKNFGIETVCGENLIVLKKKEQFSLPKHFEYDFLKVPDLAQSIAVLCAGLGIDSLFTGLQTLKIKETDRIQALQNELRKMNVFFNKMPSKHSKKTGIEYFLLEGKANVNLEYIPSISTYNDHRMAMSFAPLGLIFPIMIENPRVVSKSYPAFWDDIKSLGFTEK